MISKQISRGKKTKLIESKWVGIFVAVIVLIIIGAFGFPIVGNFLGNLSFEVTKIEGYDTFKGLDYVFVVKCGITNKGLFSGTAKIAATFEGQGKSEKQTREVFLGKGDYKEIEFVYDISFWGGIFDASRFYYSCYKEL